MCGIPFCGPTMADEDGTKRRRYQEPGLTGRTSRDTNYALSRFGIILITFLNTCVALPKRFVPKSDPILII